MISAFAFFALTASPAYAQAKSRTYAITGAKIHTLAGPAIEGGTVVIRDGKIADVGKSVAVPSGATVINGRGLEVYPGMFDAVSQMGLIEIGQGVNASVDTRELEDFSPQLVAASAIHPPSEHIPVARAAGITHTMSSPGMGGGGGFGGGGGALVGGQSSLINLDGWVVADMVVKKSGAMVVNWPSLGGGGGGGFGGGGQQQQRSPADVRRDYEARVQVLTTWLDRARHYAQAMEKGATDNFVEDRALAAMVPVVKGELPVLALANSDRDIRNAVEYFEKQKIKVVIGRARDAWKVKDLLKQKNVPVILSQTLALPANEDDGYDRPMTTAAELQKAGVKFAIASFDSGNSEVDSLTLAQEAGVAAAYGLPWEEAVKAVTLYPAQIWGVADKLGSIEKGKIANLVVTNGDLLELKTEIRYVFVNGAQSSLDNRHKQLYEKYRARP
jgi:imidazolonepropionase-like amidohydrolase